MWVIQNMRPSRKKCMKVLMLLFLQVHRLPASHLKVTDVYAISQLLLPRLMELMSNIEEQAEAEWCPGFVRGNSLYRSWTREHGNPVSFETADEFLSFLNFNPVWKYGRKFAIWVANMEIDSLRFDLEKFDGGPISRCVRPGVKSI